MFVVGGGSHLCQFFFLSFIPIVTPATSRDLIAVSNVGNEAVVGVVGNVAAILGSASVDPTSLA
jgi:hypothetical protein